MKDRTIDTTRALEIARINRDRRAAAAYYNSRALRYSASPAERDELRRFDRFLAGRGVL